MAAPKPQIVLVGATGWRETHAANVPLVLVDEDFERLLYGWAPGQWTAVRADREGNVVWMGSDAVAYGPTVRRPLKFPTPVPANDAVVPGSRAFARRADHGEGWWPCKVLHTVEARTLKGGPVVSATTPARRILVEPMPAHDVLTRDGTAWKRSAEKHPRDGLLLVGRPLGPLSTVADHDPGVRLLVEITPGHWTPSEVA